MEQTDTYWIKKGDGYATSQDKVFPFLAQPDINDDPYDPRTWRKAQPHLGVTVFEDFYQEQVAKSQLTHSYFMEFMIKNLNQFVRDESEVWVIEDSPSSSSPPPPAPSSMVPASRRLRRTGIC